MRTQKSTWFDFDRQVQVFGIKVFHDGVWVSAGDSQGQFFFDSELEMEEKRKELRSKELPK